MALLCYWHFETHSTWYRKFKDMLKNKIIFHENWLIFKYENIMLKSAEPATDWVMFKRQKNPAEKSRCRRRVNMPCKFLSYLFLTLLFTNCLKIAHEFSQLYVLQSLCQFCRYCVVGTMRGLPSPGSGRPFGGDCSFQPLPGYKLEAFCMNSFTYAFKIYSPLFFFNVCIYQCW